MVLFLITVIHSFLNINTFIFGVQKFKREYCFSKEITLNDQRITYNFATIGEKKEYVDTVLRQMTPKRKDIYSTSKSETGEFKTNPLNPGKYNLCFYPYSTNVFQISFNFQSSEEDEGIKNIATDTQMKEIRGKIDEIKNGMRLMDTNANNLFHRKFTHLLYLTNYVSQIQTLTFLKIFVVGLISFFQIFVIKKMFGDDKRISKIQTNQKIDRNNKIEFL